MGQVREIIDKRPGEEHLPMVHFENGSKKENLITEQSDG